MHNNYIILSIGGCLPLHMFRAHRTDFQPLLTLLFVRTCYDQTLAVTPGDVLSHVLDVEHLWTNITYRVPHRHIRFVSAAERFERVLRSSHSIQFEKKKNGWFVNSLGTRRANRRSTCFNGSVSIDEKKKKHIYLVHCTPLKHRRFDSLTAFLSKFQVWTTRMRSNGSKWILREMWKFCFIFSFFFSSAASTRRDLM